MDLVVDDASHLFEPTRVTFNRLYPRLRPGGSYVIEDWPMHRLPEIDTPLTVFILELVVACVAAPGSIAKVTMNRDYAVVTRGDAELRPESFDLSHYHGSRARSLIERLL